MKITTDPLVDGCPFVRLDCEYAWLFIYTKGDRVPEVEIKATGKRKVFERNVHYLRVFVDSDSVGISGGLG
jgi:hypothetical protein